MTASEPIITCPHCRAEIKLTESLAAPLIAATRQDFEQQLARKDAEVSERLQALQQQRELLDQQRAQLQEQLAQRLEQERATLAAEETKKARERARLELDAKTREATELKELLAEREQKLTEAQRAQAALLRKERELDAAKREMELTIEKQVQAGLAAARQQAGKEAEESLKLKVQEKEQIISAMQKQIEELKQRAEQGSQQLQGEVQELDLEQQLRVQFPSDTIEPVPKGIHGGDILHRVAGPHGTVCGTILWESKRTKNYSPAWLPKLRDDQRNAKAELALLVTQALPNGVDTFDFIDNVWVTHPRTAMPVAMLLRQSLIEIASSRQAAVGQQSKMELLYAYLTGPAFRQCVATIVEAFSAMQKDLDTEKRAITRSWAKRTKQIELVMRATVGMYGDMQGIAGKSLQEVEGLSLDALPAPSDYEPAAVDEDTAN